MTETNRIEFKRELTLELATDTTELVNRCTDLGLRPPEFYQNESFRTILWRKTTNHESNHNSDHDTNHDSGSKADYQVVIKLLLTKKSVHFPIKSGVLFWLLVMLV